MTPTYRFPIREASEQEALRAILAASRRFAPGRWVPWGDLYRLAREEAKDITESEFDEAARFAVQGGILERRSVGDFPGKVEYRRIAG